MGKEVVKFGKEVVKFGYGHPPKPGSDAKIKLFTV